MPELRRSAVAVLGAGGAVALLLGLATAVLVPAHADDADGKPTSAAATSDATAAATETPTAPAPTTMAPEPSDPTSASPASEPTDSPTGPTGPTETATDDPTDGPTEVAGATLRWGVNNESNTAAYAPGTYNFFSAGKVPDPGRGGQQIKRNQWRRSAGNVAIQKWDTDSTAWRPATWAGLSTDSEGNRLSIGRFSNHTMVFSGGTGEVDRSAGTARIAWDGAATVLYYSGMSFFYVDDPVLEVADGSGRITAEVSGFASALDDLTKWEPVAPRRVTIAVLPSVALDDPDGFTAEPAYRGVRVSLDGGSQVRSGADWGAFPQSFVSHMERLGTAPYWYSSGGGADPNKPPLPVTVGFGGAPSQAPPPSQPAEVPTVPDNSAPPAPAPPDPPNAPAPAAAPPAAAPAAAQQEAALPARPNATPIAALPQPATEVRLASSQPAASPGPPAGGSRPWWAGGALLLLAAAALLVPAPRR